MKQVLCPFWVSQALSHTQLTPTLDPLRLITHQSIPDTQEHPTSLVSPKTGLQLDSVGSSLTLSGLPVNPASGSCPGQDDQLLMQKVVVQTCQDTLGW